MLFYRTGLRTIAAMLVWTAVLGGCGRDAALGGMDEQREPAVRSKATSSPASVIPVLGVRG
ncbi:MAG TPA: hypothetical protein VF450_26270 [Noviherbaspirillum sp.]